MRSTTLKWIVLSATLLAAIVVTVQLYWLKKVYSFEQRQFNLNVVKSIRGLFEDLQMNDAPGTVLQSLINAPEKTDDYYVFKADTIPIKDERCFPKLTILSCAPLLADAMSRIFRNESVSELFQDWK